MLKVWNRQFLHLWYQKFIKIDIHRSKFYIFPMKGKCQGVRTLINISKFYTSAIFEMCSSKFERFTLADSKFDVRFTISWHVLLCDNCLRKEMGRFCGLYLPESMNSEY